MFLNVRGVKEPPEGETHCEGEMDQNGKSRVSSVGRTILAVIAGYLTNAVLIVVTEQFLSSLAPRSDATPPLCYFVIDLIRQCLIQVAAGYLCCVIARPSQRIALTGLIGLGLLVGTIFLVASWKSEPHWYGLGLLFVYAPCVWIGWALRGPVKPRSLGARASNKEKE